MQLSLVTSPLNHSLEGGTLCPALPPEGGNPRPIAPWELWGRGHHSTADWANPKVLGQL